MLESIQKSEEGLSAEELDLLDRLLEQEIPAASGIRRRPDRRWAPLSFAQERFWFLDHWQPGNPSFHIFTLVRLEGDLDVEALRRGLSEIVRRHEVLRSVFEARDQGPIQIVVPHGGLPLPRIDLRALSRCRRESEARRLAERDARRPFDLRRGPLLRIYLAQIGPREHQLFLTTHHIVSDGWSTGILVRELMALYPAFSRGETAFLPELRLQYGDFAAWQRQELTEVVLEEQLTYWQRQLDGAPAVLELPTDRPRPAVRSFAGACLGRTLPRSVNDVLEAFCSRRRGVTPFMALVAAFKTLLHRYTGQRDLVIGTPVANRHRMEIEELIGCFVNSLVLRTDLGGDPRWCELVERLREVTLDAYAHQDLPFEKLVETLGLERDPAHTPLFQVVLVLQNTPRLAVDLPGITLEALEIENYTAKFDLTATFSPEADGGLLLSFEYSRELFDVTTIDRMSRHFRQLLVGTLADPQRRLSELPLLRASEQHELLHEWNVPAEVGCSLCLPQRFEAQVEHSPDAVALIDADRKFSYRELNARANRLAHRLTAMGAGPETLVGILSDRRAEMVVAILAVLKAGSGYLPLDPAYPDERLHFLLADARAPWVLTQAGVVERLRGHRTRVLDLDELLRTAAGESCENPPPAAAPENLAYVIYTSGSTGRPKGVMVTHAHVGRLFDVTAAGFRFGPGDVWTFFHSHAFDFSVWEIWGALNYGGRLVVVPYLTSRSPEAFYQLLSGEGVSVLNQTPSAFRQLVRAEQQLVSAERLPLALRLVIFGGEALEPSSLASWVERHGGVRLVNMYGITETTVHVTQHPVGAEDVRSGRSLIGRPIPDLGVHVLDARGRLLPIAVPGELFVGGGGVTRGYLGRPALTARRFVPDPWSGRPGARLYRTGDLGRRLANGCLEYLGRIDNQVQIRGFRVELGEIEAALEEHPAVARAVVVAREEGQGDHRLVGYVVPQGAEPGLDKLRSFLREKLPEHMVPAILVPLARVPLTAHGKVDVRALPEPAPARPELEHSYVPPQTPVEEILAEIWGEVLGVFPVGIHDNFFSLGGDSIRSVQVISLAKQRGLELSLPRLFELQTVHELAAELTSGSATVRGLRSAPFSLISESDRRALPAGIVDAYPLTYMQAGMLYHMALDPEHPPYHNVDSSHLRASIELERFREAVQWVVDRHPALRTSFDMESFSEPLQLVHESAALRIGYEDLSSLSPDEQEEVIKRFRSAERRRLFDLSRPPLLRFHIHRRSEDTLQFTLSECHPILDGWSLTSTLAEIFDAYFQLLDHGRVTPRPLPPVTFRDFVQLEREALASEETRDFWNEKLDGAVMTRLPRWPVHLREAGTGIRRQLRHAPDDTLPGLKKLAAEAKVPLKSVLLAAYLKTLSLVTGQSELLTGLSTNGRLEEPGGDQVRGIHLNTLPLRLRLSAGSWLELARQAWAAESEILPHRRFPGAALHKERGNEPLFETLFNFTHFHSLADVMRSDRCELLDYQWSQDTHFPLLVTFSIVPGSSRLGVVLSCDSGEIGAVQMEGIAEHLEHVLAAMAADPHGLHSTTPFLAAAKRRRILEEWAVDRAKYPRRSTIPKLVAKQVERTPEAVAVVCGERSLSYAELRRESLSLAAQLRGLGLGRGSRVGLFAEHSPETVAAILGVLEIGAAYVPLDPAHPPARLRWLAKDAGLDALITQGPSAGALPVALPTIVLGPDQTPPAAVSAPAPEAEDVAYVIYTSGSTGRPKGVAVSHRSLVNYVWWAKNTYLRGEALDFPLYSSLAFDLTVTSLYTPLVTGNRLVVYPQQGQEPAILDIVRDDRVGVLKLTPSHLTLITDAAPEGGRRLRRLILGGEDLEADLARRAEALFGAQIEILNEYGPTEATVGCMLHCFDPAGDGEGSVPIGGPGANARIFILDPWLNPVDVGVPGELYLGGDGVAQGYLGRPGMSAERFVPDPFSRRKGARLYRTGDLARWFPGGRAEFLGRRDEQVKVRGHRTELGEIRAAINRHPKIRDSVVRVASDPSGKTLLVAYYAARQELPETDLRTFLREHLLAETVPSFFVHLKRLPLTLNGKVNVDALPRLSELREERAPAFEPPRTPVEEAVASIWQEVLEVERVGRTDNFFEIGGHSLLAGRVISRLRAVFDLELPLRALLEAPTVEALAKEVIERVEAGLPQRIPPLEPRRDSTAPPLSFAQQRLWFLDRLAPGSAAYNMPAAVRIAGSLCFPALEGALDEIVRRHESLRTRFEAVDGEPVQIVSPPSPINLLRIDLSGHGSLGRDRLEAELERLLRREVQRPFDLAHEALLRLALVRFSETEHVFFFNLHHIVSDGWSMGILVRELGALHRGLAQRRPCPLPELPVQYADYAVWQRGWLRGVILEAQLTYWREQLADLPALDLPVDRSYPSVAGSEGASCTRALPAELSQTLAAVGRSREATPFMVFTSALAALLSRYSGQRDFGIGTPVTGRHDMKLEPLIGLFVNTLVLRCDLGANPPFDDLVDRMRGTAIEALAHQDVPFEKLVEELQPERALHHQPFFQTMLAYQEVRLEEVELPGVRLELREMQSGSAKFDLTWVIEETGQEPFLTLNYRSDLFDATTALRMLRQFQILLEEAAADSGRRLSDLPLLAAAERHQLVTELATATEPAAEPGTLHGRFEEQTARTPAAPALVWGPRRLTFAELDRFANQVARDLRSRGVGLETVVGIFMEHCPEMLVAILAVLKAGGAYLPLDPELPAERLAFMAKDAGASLLLTRNESAGTLAGPEALAIDIDELAASAEHCESPRLPMATDHLAYVIYTSGSTGHPKATMVPHRGVVNYLEWSCRHYPVQEGDGSPVHSPLSFDLTVTSLFSPLLAGRGVWLSPAGEGVDPLVEALSDEGSDVAQRFSLIKLTPAHLNALQYRLPTGTLRMPRALVVGGEALSGETVAAWRRRAPETRIFNEYGPTETVVGCSVFEVPAGKEPSGAVPIGRAIAGTRLYVVDRHFSLTPWGIPGELCVAGDGVTRGYLIRPALTAQSFVPDPFSNVPGSRLYRTGDLVRYQADGHLVFLGRQDHQVKVRGYRIELGEIEAVLGQSPDVAECVVTAREDLAGDRRLAAYCTPAGERPLEASELRSFLAVRLPEYMVPSHFVALDTLPLTAHGKVDQKALPSPLASTERRVFKLPRTPVEEVLAEIWSEVLGIERIGREDSFFDLGGHSLLAVRLMSRIRSTFRVDVALRVLFEARTVAALAERVEEALRIGAQLSVPPLTPMPRDGALPLSFAQERLWFLDQLHPGSSAYNMPLAVRLTGELDLGALARSLSEVMRRHENLRTVFELVDGEPRQSIRPAAPIAPRLVDLRTLAPAERKTEARRQVQAEARRAFDLARGPLVRALFLRLEPAEHVVLIHLHHIVSDGWSLGILQAELQALYQALLAGKPSPLPELEIQYADFALWQRGWLEGEVLEAQLAYWREQLAGVPTLELPADHPRPAAPSHRGATRALALPGEVARGISALGRAQGATPYMVLLAGLKVLLYRYTGQRDLSVGTPVAGRHHMEIEKLVGLFVNTLVLRTRLPGELSFCDLVDRVRDTALAAYTHQDIPFEKLVEELQPERSLNRHPLFQVMFAYQDQRAPRLELPGTTLHPAEVQGSTVRFDLSWRISETGSGMVVALSHRSELFEPTTAERLLRHFRNLLQGATADPGRWLADLPLLAPAQRHQLLNEFHGTPAGTVALVTLHGGFECQAAEAPDRVALSAGDEELTYSELEARSNQLAHHLHRLGVGSEVRVAICSERSPERMVGVLGVLKAGAAYVPLDPRHPAERLSFLLEDCGAELLLIQERLLAVLPETVKRSRRWLLLDGEAFAGESTERLPVEIEPDQLAYVIYTSGSTGQPKGVMIPHRGLPHRLAWLRDHLTLSGNDRVLVKTSSVFDVSLRELFWPLSAGARLVLAPPGAERDSSALVELLRGERITAVQFVPSMLAYLAEEEAFAACPLRHLISGGEVLPPALARTLGKQLAAELYNSYGPTETSLFATLRTGARIPADGPVPLGRPLPGTGAYVLDRCLQPQPIGVAGELVLSGVGLGRGYLGKPGQTADRFVPHPFSNDRGARLYRTGDLVRWRPDGELEFLGRVDDQVKVRGFRIELGEIEACLATQPAVRQAAVRVREDASGNLRLVAYVTLRDDPQAGSEPFGDETLVQELARTLPDYMIPSHFVVLEAFPLLPSGKIDRGALPAPAWTDRPTEKTYVPPRDPFELELVGIWEEVLGVRPVGIRDNFFELGGHSLLAVRLATRIEQKTGRRLPLASLFQAPTLRELSPLLRSGLPEEPPAALVGIRPQGSARPLFLVHGGGGNVLSYAPLAAHLDPERPVYGLQSIGLHEGQELASGVAEMAAQYLEEMRTVAPSGPYLLAGWSAGGTIAFEMAQQLLDQDEQASLLLLIDAYARQNRPPRFPDTLSLLGAFAAELGVQTPPAALVTELFAELESLPPEQQLTRALELAREAQLLPGGIELPRLRRLFRVFEANVRAVAAYEPRPYPGRAVVVRAAEGNPSAGPDLGWSEWIAEIAETAAVPGDHYGILRPGGAEALAELLNRWSAQM